MIGHQTSWHTVKGRTVHKATVFEEGVYWRWQIVDEYGTQYTDGGNFKSREEAEASLAEAFDPQ